MDEEFKREIDEELSQTHNLALELQQLIDLIPQRITEYMRAQAEEQAKKELPTILQTIREGNQELRKQIQRLNQI